MPSMMITDRDPVIYHSECPTHRAVNQAITAAQTVENMAWDAVDHISEAIHDGESWSGLDTGEMYEAHRLANTLARNASDALLAAKKAQWVTR